MEILYQDQNESKKWFGGKTVASFLNMNLFFAYFKKLLLARLQLRYHRYACLRYANALVAGMCYGKSSRSSGSSCTKVCAKDD